MSKTFYKCILTGADDSLTDLVLPISNFSARLKSGTPSYMEVTVPNALDYIDGIAARPNGDIVVYHGLQEDGAAIDWNEIARVNFELAPYDKGAESKTVRISGYKQTTYSSPSTVALTGVSGESLQSDGKMRVRAQVDYVVRPADTVTWNSGTDSMVAGMITLTVSAEGQQTMDITEA